ncbi:MAG: hypothetical protein JWQ97_1935 [Phenylobacterium sp.]|jgi:hypothetical protein|nr:hypothetical protein [Phenylobacterium sp.]
MKRKLVLPWRYLAMLAVGLAVLWALMARYGPSARVLIGWLVAWLFVSRGVDFLVRRRRKRVRFEDEEES